MATNAAEQAAKKISNPSGNPLFEVGGLAAAEIDEPIRCGVLGLGRIGWAHHSKAIMEHPGFALAAVCDLEAERVEEARAASGCAGYGAFGEVLADEAVELVVVATQSKDHEAMSIAALEAGKHVLCEKPAAQSVAGIDRMLAAARAAGKVLTMHHNYRRNPEFLFVRELMASGRLGKVFRIRRRVAGFGRRNDWQVLRKYGGGMTGNWGVHLVDQGLQLMDSPVAFVWGSVHHFFNPGDAEDDIKAIIEAEDGMVLDIDMTSVDASDQPSWAVCGTQGTLWIKGKEAHLKYFDPTALPAAEVNDLHYALERKYGMQPGEKIEWHEETCPVKPSGEYDSYYDNLYRAVRQGAPLIVSPESARITYDVLDRIRASSDFAVS